MSFLASSCLSTWSVASLQEFADVLEVGVLTVDTGLVLRNWSRWLEAASGRAASDVIGCSLLDLFPELQGGAAEAAFRNALAGTATVMAQRFHGYLLPLPAAAGFPEVEHMQQSARIVPLLREDGSIDGALALIQDVTERVAREEELRVAMQRAEDASRGKSEFLAAMSHDFKTPLAAIIGYANLIEGEMAGPVTSLQKQHLTRVKRSARHLIGMIEEVLAFATIEAGKETLRLEDFDAVGMGRETTEMLEADSVERGIRLELALPAAPVPIRSDKTKVRQILVNLLGNALKFTEEGSVTLEVEPVAGGVRFHVRDTGPGIDPADVERIFEPFTRVHRSETQHTSGTGLGLPVSRRLARLLDGDLTVESRRGEGSTFTLWLRSHGDARALALVPDSSE